MKFVFKLFSCSKLRNEKYFPFFHLSLIMLGNTGNSRVFLFTYFLFYSFISILQLWPTFCLLGNRKYKTIFPTKQSSLHLNFSSLFGA